MQIRKSDGPDGTVPEYPRNSRFAETDDGWFFLTREGVSVGPYESRFDAELSASLLVARLSQLDDAGGAACLIQGFLGDPSNPLKRPRPRARSVPLRRSGSMAMALSAVQRAWSVLRSSAPA